jgi:hypothetical protein
VGVLRFKLGLVKGPSPYLIGPPAERPAGGPVRRNDRSLARTEWYVWFYSEPTTTAADIGGTLTPGRQIHWLKSKAWFRELDFTVLISAVQVISLKSTCSLKASVQHHQKQSNYINEKMIWFLIIKKFIHLRWGHEWNSCVVLETSESLLSSI